MQPEKNLAAAHFDGRNHREYEYSIEASKQTFAKVMEIQMLSNSGKKVSKKKPHWWGVQNLTGLGLTETNTNML
jgi:hypothetical protein